MPDHEVKFSYAVYPDLESLPEADQRLIAEAVKAVSMAYAPYSKFKVGAAIRTTGNAIIVGSNQENEAFPIGQCAERVALYSMVHTIGRKPIDTMAIAVEHADQKTPASPCGSCRQILCEYRRFQQTPIRLLLTLAKGGEVYEIYDVPDILPFAFDGSFLGL
jgi:cytidine deaminase